MKVVATTDEYTIYQKRNERYAVRKSDRAWINGDEKTAILLEHKLIKAAPVKAPEPEPEAEAEASEEAVTEEGADASAEAADDADGDAS